MKNLILTFSLIIVCMLCSTKALSQTINPPVGVTCPSNNSSFVFEAEFDDYNGWTGDLTNTNNGGQWEVPGNANSSGTGPDSAYSGANYMNYEASGNAQLLSASAISPVIDLTTATDEAELSFYMHAYGEGMGTLEVGISNSISGPFTNLFTWSGQLQTSGGEPWVPVGVNLDSYLGQSIYLEFKQTRTDNFRGDMSIDLVRVETCGSICASPTVSVDGVDSDDISASVDFSWIANDSETSWEYAIQIEGTGTPTSGTTSLVQNVTENGLLFGTDYEVYVRANCTNGNSIWAGPLLFTTPIKTDFIIDCSAGPITETMCYGDNGVVNPEIFTFTSIDGSALTLNFYSGFIDEGWDPLVVIDTDGTFIVPYDDYFFGNEGNLSGLSYTSTGDTISFYIASDDFVPSSCANGDAPMNGGITYTVACATCTNSEATYTIVDDCDNGSQFLIDVNVTSLGSATSLTISNNVDTNTATINAIGTYQIGPFPFFTDIIYTLTNNQDANCVFNSLPILVRSCIPDNDDCDSATIVTVNTDDSCTELAYGTILSASPSNVAAVSCDGDADDDVWFQFVAINDTQIIEFLNIVENDVASGLNHAVYEGSCGALNELYCMDGGPSVTPQLVIGDTYYIRVFSEGSEDEDVSFDLCIRPGFNSIEVSDSAYTIEELVQDVLFASDCANVSNITFTTGTSFDPFNPNGIGYFSMDGDQFPFSEGLLLSTGHAEDAAGPNDDTINSSGSQWVGDTDLDTILGVDSRNATIIEFDFVPYSQNISFDFLMASEEYNGGSYECTYSDAFAFFLTDSNDNTTNLAVIPNTTTPILVTTVHPSNDDCPAINEAYFGEYTPDNLPPMDYNGRTVVFTAQSAVNIGETYHIKLVVADDSDSQFDTGIFIEAGSFEIGELTLGDDFTIDAGTASCLNEPVVLDTQAPNLEHVWYRDGLLISEESSSILTVSEPGVYTAQVIFSNQCIISDEITVEFLETPIANPANDLLECSATNQAFFDLTENNPYILGNQIASEYTITYHLNEQDAIANSSPLPTVYENVSDPQIIYARIESNTSGCFATTSFFIILTNPSHIAESVDLFGCDNDGDGVASFDLEAHNVDILNGQDETQFLVSYYLSEADAIAAIGALPDLYDSSGETLYVRMESVDFTDCFVTNSFNLIIGVDPITSFSLDIEYEICPNASSPFIIDAIPENYAASEVTVYWYRDGGIILDENTLSLPVLEGGLYEVEVVFNDTGCFGLSEVTVTESGICVFPQGISPGVSPGQNDNFDLRSFNVTKLEIFNRNGTLVYSKDNYTNEWYGQTDDGDELPVGTYFYTVIYEGGAKSKSSWVYINR
ncbi:choice-of-anchor L domain-containing protein [uncultured Winogradskyella sp.]|uniref:choice-of-anchor L domain-containing protein n=1 Tax=uncultured Winogradskyella sp. TaxID=395353 RepID=UPI00263261A3|nr:choice-of-anchor L domain-containing protein [uncultured Winogradskyella sp.]